MHQTLRTRVTMWKMRNTLRKHGIEIRVLRSVGYSIDDENKKKLTELMKERKK
jgi:biotin operon repressor